jgi:hypothetical protein
MTRSREWVLLLAGLIFYCTRACAQTVSGNSTREKRCPNANSTDYTLPGCPCMIPLTVDSSQGYGRCPAGYRCSPAALRTLQEEFGLFEGHETGDEGTLAFGACFPCMLGEQQQQQQQQQATEAHWQQSQQWRWWCQYQPTAHRRPPGSMQASSTCSSMCVCQLLVNSHHIVLSDHLLHHE